MVASAVSVGFRCVPPRRPCTSSDYRCRCSCAASQLGVVHRLRHLLLYLSPRPRARDLFSLRSYHASVCARTPEYTTRHSPGLRFVFVRAAGTWRLSTDGAYHVHNNNASSTLELLTALDRESLDQMHRCWAQNFPIWRAYLFDIPNLHGAQLLSQEAQGRPWLGRVHAAVCSGVREPPSGMHRSMYRPRLLSPRRTPRVYVVAPSSAGKLSRFRACLQHAAIHRSVTEPPTRTDSR